MISRVRLQNFRSYEDASFEFSNGVNIIVGPNGSGKTNLLEAILVASRGSSYRARDSELVRFDQPWARVDITLFDGKKRSVKLINNPQPEKTYEIDENILKRLSRAYALPVVLFEPNHLRILTGSPEVRRDYIDDLLEQIEPGYGAVRRKYKRALLQRNTLLKNPTPPTKAQLFPWNVRLSELGGKIVRTREQLIERINKDTSLFYTSLSGENTRLRFEHQKRWPAENYETRFLKELEDLTQTDHSRGFTTTGPHKDDLLALLDGHKLQQTASRGEARTAALALKFTELRLIEEEKGGPALLLLDDVYGELDEQRRKNLTNHIGSHQAFITTTGEDTTTRVFVKQCNIIVLI